MCFLCSVNVLIIHQHFRLPQEGGAIRSYYLAKALAERGIRVDVVTATSAQHYALKVIEGMNVHYLPVPYDNKFGFWRRGSAFLKFVWSAANLSARLPGLDVCYAISVPLTTGLTAMWLKRNRGLSYIFEVGDLWPDAPIALGFVKDRLLQTLLKKLERKIYLESTAVVALSEPIRKAIQQKVPDKEIFVIPNMSDIAFYGSRGDDNELRMRHDLQHKFIVSYIGAVGFANGLDHLLECARSAQQARANVHFFICGEGAMLDQHKINAQRLQLANLTFLPFTNREGVKEIMDATDAVFVSYKPFRILETGSPNKYFDGLAAGKLILLNFEGWIKEEVEREQCGVYIDRQRPEKFADTIAPFIQDGSLLRRYQLSAKRLALRQYSRELLTNEFVSLIQAKARA
jgi:glycosyltransferase involved in cell wall biosynthesis